MNEAIAAAILLISIIFIWKMVKGIEIHITVGTTKVILPEVQVKIEQPPVQFVDVSALNDAQLKEEMQAKGSDKEKPREAVAAFNDYMLGIEEVMSNDR